MRKATTGVLALDRVWHVTTAIFQQLARLSPDDRAQVVAAVTNHWKALPVIAAVGGDVEDDDTELAPQLPLPAEVPKDAAA